MRSGASQDGVVGADDGLDAGHSVHHPERQQEPMSNVGTSALLRLYMCFNAARSKRGKTRTCYLLCTASYSQDLCNRFTIKTIITIRR